MEIDSGSGVSLIGRDIYDSCFSGLTLRDPQLALKAWNSTTLPVAGQINVTVSLGQKTAQLPLLVMAASGPSLLGRQWFAALGIQSPSPPSASVLHAAPTVTATSDVTSLPEQLKKFGYIVSGSGVQPSDDKVRPILLARSPSSKNELQVYLGAINYYDRFFANKSHHFYPLYQLLRADTPWKWTEVEERAIQFVRVTLSSPPLLRSFDINLPLILATDACQHGLGCVLSHLQSGEERGATSNVWFTNPYIRRVSVLGDRPGGNWSSRKVIIYVDHKPLTGIFRGAGKPIPEVLSPRILRLCLEAAAFDYSLVYREGKKHANADFCSRFPVDKPPNSTPEEPAVVMFLSTGTERTPVFAQAIARETAADPVTSQVVTAIERGTPRLKLPKEVRAYMVGQPGALAVQAGCILFGSRVVIPPSLRPQVLQRLHQYHQGM
ncbi:UNVERIFIED_CONTAM: hypothetical protein B566_EDAN019220, partial [Ephemera danica]